MILGKANHHLADRQGDQHASQAVLKQDYGNVKQHNITLAQVFAVLYGFVHCFFYEQPGFRITRWATQTIKKFLYPISPCTPMSLVSWGDH